MITSIQSRLRQVKDKLNSLDSQELGIAIKEVLVIQHELKAVTILIQARLIQAEIDNVESSKAAEE